MLYGVKKFWQSFRGVLELKSAKKGVLCLPEIGHWQGAANGRRGLGTNARMGFRMGCWGLS